MLTNQYAVCTEGVGHFVICIITDTRQDDDRQLRQSCFCQVTETIDGRWVEEKNCQQS